MRYECQVSPCGDDIIMRPKAATYQPSSGGDLPVDGCQCPEGADDGFSMRGNG